MDLERALLAHAAWTQRLHDAAAGVPSSLDTARIASAEGCALGEWLQTEGQARLGHRPEWQRCQRVHADFHRAAGAVAAALNRGDTAAARAMLAAGTPYAGASQALTGALRALAEALAQLPVPSTEPGPAAARTAQPRGTAPA